MFGSPCACLSRDQRAIQLQISTWNNFLLNTIRHLLLIFLTDLWKSLFIFSLKTSFGYAIVWFWNGWCRRKHRITENFMAARLKINFFVLLRVALLVSQVILSGVKNSFNFVGTLSFCGGRRVFDIYYLLTYFKIITGKSQTSIGLDAFWPSDRV